MKEGWEIKSLDTLFDVKSSKRVHKSDWKSEGVPFYRAREVVKLAQNGFVDNELFISERLFKEFTKDRGAPKKGDIIVSAVGTLGECYLVKKDDRFYFKDASVLWLENISGVNTRYIEYAFKSDMIRDQVMYKSMGATVGTLTISRAKIIEIPIPPLPEQKQIVKLLDQAFEAIDQAIANIEKNIANAKELFQSKLNEVFSQEGEGWETKLFNELFKLKSGNGLTAKKMIEGPFPVYGGNGISGYHNEYNFESPQVIVGRVGAWCGNVRLIKEKFWLTDNAFRISNDLKNFNLKFLVYLLNFVNLRSYARQAAQPVISNSSLKDITITYPISIEIQKEISLQIEILYKNLDDLEKIYSQKLTSLEELKKSILQKAFSGELTNPN